MWSADELTALGKVVMNFAGLDACVDRLLAGFINESSVAEIIVAGQAIGWKVEKLAVIADEYVDDPDAKEALLDWLEATGRLNARRNQMIHSWYSDGGKTGSLTRMKASTRGRKWQAESEPIQFEQIQELATLIEQGIDAAHSLAQALRETGHWHGELLALNSGKNQA